MKYLLFLGLCFYGFMLGAQIPSTNIYLFDYRNTATGAVFLNDPRILTAENLGGYNNQPAFFEDDALFFTRQKAGTNQTDLLRLDLDKEESLRFTQTRQSEYSPTRTPDGEHLSCIRVEDDGTQVLWQYPMDRSHAGKRILPHVKDIGYHFWLNDKELILFIVGDPVQLVHANLNNKEVNKISTKIGRCFGRLPDGRILFVYKYTDEIWHIKAYDQITKRSRFIAETVPGSEDFTILGDGSLIMGSDDRLYQMNTPYLAWKEIADLSSYNIAGISRVAYRAGRLAVVAN